MAGIAWCVAPHNDTRGQSTSVADVLTSPNPGECFKTYSSRHHDDDDETETEIYNLYTSFIVSPFISSSTGI